jgi:hypothetical protein
MRLALLAAAGAALILTACGQAGSGPGLPPVKEGAQAPSTQTAPTGTVQRANITDDVRQSLITNIDGLLDQMQDQLGGTPMAGWTDQIVPMEPGSDHRQNVSLTAGTAYRIVGACDGDCTNFDIEVIDVSTGGVVASDMLPDDWPIVNYTPPANGQFIVRSLMQTCNVAPCFAGTRVLTAGAAEAPQQAAGSGGKP